MRWIQPPGGNKIYLTCSGCKNYPLELGRRQFTQFSKCPKDKDFEVWFESHRCCEGGPDKFKLAYERNPNWDQPIDAPLSDNAVRLELVKSNV